MQDELLIRRAQRGDADAFEQLLLEHQKNVYNLCYRMAGNPDDAMDLSQETFLRAWRCLDQYQFASAFSVALPAVQQHLHRLSAQAAPAADRAADV